MINLRIENLLTGVGHSDGFVLRCMNKQLELFSVLAKLFYLEVELVVRQVEDVVLLHLQVLHVREPAADHPQRNRHFWPNIVLPDPVEETHADQGEVDHVDEDYSSVLSVVALSVSLSQEINQPDQVALKGGHSVLQLPCICFLNCLLLCWWHLKD